MRASRAYIGTVDVKKPSDFRAFKQDMPRGRAGVKDA